jgi:glycosidase
MMSWFSKAIIYHIFIDRFAGFLTDSDASKADFCGGNIKSITEKIEYIKNLGANTIWISPFYQTSAYHGYHITDFDKVDKRFGSFDDLKNLVSECHRNHIKIIADIVPNHCSDKHAWFVDAIKNEKSKYHNWFYFEKWPHSYLRFLEFNDLPKINLENSETASYMIDSLVKWAQIGFDGFRIDHILGIPDKFLLKLRKELLNVNNSFILIGEAWSDGLRYKHLKTLKIKGKYSLWKHGLTQIDTQKHYNDIIDGVLDFGWRDLVLQNLKRIQNDIKAFKKLEATYNQNFPVGFLIPRFLDNHDTSRIFYNCGMNEKLFKIVLNLLTGQNQPIVIYYGTEYGLTHKKAVAPEVPYTDLQSRGLIQWQNEALYYKFIADLLRLRS